MQSPLDFSLDSFSGQPEEITLTHTNGETISLDPLKAQMRVVEAPTPLTNMEADLGAVCEVFRQKRDYYISLSGVTLAPGDMLAVRYHNSSAAILFRVMDLENGLAHVTFHTPPRKS